MKFFKNWLDRPIRRHTGLLPIAQTDPDDVFIVGYPKSGHTWMQTLIAGTVYGLDPGYLSYAVVDDLIPDVHARSYYRRYGTPMHFKSHRLPQPDYRRVIYVLRDGRDVMISYYHHLKALYGSAIDFATVVRTGEHVYPGKWHEHVEAWKSNPYKAQILVLKYEDLLDDPVKQLGRVCDFLTLDRSLSLLKLVAEGSSFRSMRAREEEFGLQDERWPMDQFFIRRGQLGSHKDEMPGQILDLFMTDAAETLRDFAYI